MKCVSYMWCDLFLQKLSPLVWDGLTAYLQGVFLCVQRNRLIVTDSEQITAKLKVRMSEYVCDSFIFLSCSVAA